VWARNDCCSQWEARCHQRIGNNRTGYDSDDDGSSMISGINRRGKSRYCGHCFDYGERGHMARDCRAKKDKVLLVDVDDQSVLL
jgi:hypothetical protein